MQKGINASIFSPESLMMSYGYYPAWSEGALKCPIFQTSTFVFQTAEEGKSFFEVAYGLRESHPGEKQGLIYSRLNNPDLEILENRLCIWDGADDCAVFESGMSAITTVFLEFLKPGDLVLYSTPLYGGTEHFLQKYLPKWGIHCLGFKPGMSKAEMLDIISAHPFGKNLAMIYIESPANPTNALVDIELCLKVADTFKAADKEAIVVVDNTYMGPIWQHPLQLGADLVIYSATKYIGGHSDLIAGAVLGYKELMVRVKTLRTFLGNMAGPWTGWLLMRSLESLKVRMEQQTKNAQTVAHFLKEHSKVKKVYYLGLLQADDPQYEIYTKQHSAPGAMLSFEIKGNEADAFQFLNHLKLIRLAVSLGGTESLAEHPASMTHAGINPEHRLEMGITDALIRLSIGVENEKDILWDISQALGD